jgi:hypothetical protein
MRLKEFLEEAAPRVKFDEKNVGGDGEWKKMLADPRRFPRRVVTMTPEEFLEIVRHERYKNDPEKVRRYAEGIRDGDVLPIPAIMYPPVLRNTKGREMPHKHSVFHDGQHRVRALFSS